MGGTSVYKPSASRRSGVGSLSKKLWSVRGTTYGSNAGVSATIQCHEAAVSARGMAGGAAYRTGEVVGVKDLVKIVQCCEFAGARDQRCTLLCATGLSGSIFPKVEVGPTDRTGCPR